MVRVAECERPGLLAAITGVDLFGLAEPEARERLRYMISAALAGRVKPAVAPGFPGSDRAVPQEPRFPGTSDHAEAGPDAEAAGPDAGTDDASGLRRRLFTAHVPRLPGAPAGPAPRFSLRRVDVGTRMAASTVTPTVAVSRGAQVTLLHFNDHGYHTDTVPLDVNEFLIAADGEYFASYDGRGVTMRDFATGAVSWQVAGPRNLATATVDCSGNTVAMAGGPNIVAGSNKVVVAARDSPVRFDFRFANLPMAAGCQLGISPDGQLVACASFREIVVVRPRTGEIVHRRRLAGMREDVLASLGTRPHRLVCSARGDLLWFRGRRVVDLNWAGERSRYLPQDGLCDDIAFDHATARLAMVYESGQVDVFGWTFSG